MEMYIFAVYGETTDSLILEVEEELEEPLTF